MSVLIFERTDLARAERVITAPVETVYRVLDDVESWPNWVPDVGAPTTVVDHDTYELITVRNGEHQNLRLHVTARGPAHTFFTEVEARARLCFRTRPFRSGTHVDVVVEVLDDGGWRPARRRRRELAERVTRLEVLLEKLAARVEADGQLISDSPR